MHFLLLITALFSPPDTSKVDRLSYDFRPYLEKGKLTEVVVGELYLPTGKIVANDGIVMVHPVPFKEKVAPGKYPVHILIHTVEKNHYRIAFARIKFVDRPAVKWTLALTENISDEDVRSLEASEFFGYGVDAGTGCFTDVETAALYMKEMDKVHEKGGDIFSDVLEDEFLKFSGKHPLSFKYGDWNNHFPMKGDKRNVVMFRSGWGDGSYPTYWGKDANGKIVELMTDFIVVTE
jgi:hypothetical protein